MIEKNMDGELLAERSILIKLLFFMSAFKFD